MIWLIVILGLILRLIAIDQSFWLDEATQAILSSKTVGFILFNRTADFHPPLFYLLSHIWININTSDIWLRLLPLTFGVGSIY